MCSDTDLFGMYEPSFPVCFGGHDVEFVATFQMLVMRGIGKAVACLQDRCLDHHVGTSLVQCDRIERGGDTQVWHNCCIVVVPAITFGRDVHDETDVEVGFVRKDGLRIFCNLTIQPFGSIPRGQDSPIMLAQGYTLPATYAMVIIDHGFPAFIQMDRVVPAVFYADVATDAMFPVYTRLRSAVQFQLPGYTGTSHAQILQGAAKTGL